MVRQYIGARYTIKVYTNSITPSSADWEAGVSYEPIMLVTFGGDSYLSKKPVPSNIGDPASNPDYWVIVGNTTAQITLLENKVARLEARAYNTYADAVADAGLYGEGDIIATLGYSAPGNAPGLYIIHTSSAPHYIVYGGKYAEYVFYGDTIELDALGGLTDPDTAMAVALALVMANNAPSNIAQGIYRGGGTIKFGKGMYRFDNKVTIPAGLNTITFEGINQDSELAYDGADTLFDMSYSNSDFGDNIHFRHLVFEGSGKAIRFNYVKQSSVKNCIFGNVNAVPSVKISNSVGIDIFESYFMMSGHGIEIHDNTTTVNIKSCSFATCDSAIEVNDCNGIIIKDSIIEYNNTYGFIMRRCDNAAIHNVWFEGNVNIVENSNIELIGNSFHIGTNMIVSKITVSNDTGNLLKLYAPNIDDPASLSFDGINEYTGFISYINGDTYDMTNRIKTLVNRNKFNVLDHFSGGPIILNGFYEVHGVTANYLAEFAITEGVSQTITKIAGSITAPDAYNQNGVVEFDGSIPDPTGTVIRIKY